MVGLVVTSKFGVSRFVQSRRYFQNLGQKLAKELQMRIICKLLFNVYYVWK